jgi:hypothetical protein
MDTEHLKETIQNNNQEDDKIKSTANSNDDDVCKKIEIDLGKCLNSNNKSDCVDILKKFEECKKN